MLKEIIMGPAINIILSEEGNTTYFVEIELDNGKGIYIGTRTEADFGMTKLRITASEIIAACHMQNSMTDICKCPLCYSEVKT
jgi:hypothetical protein